ncbi:cell surface protein [Secundilactobacillus paracollinoides]|uniref:Cell surface protein n=1 Tax=Secundilactobacillus paracollinoides TaxID=240427 RepID=A0A1B2IZP3_9LACO|nr:CdaR family protein [Secundilactobacillus paracollinoides]ANZ61628.1 cell surface protein [Secundilactobacillus paracollinoides]ANZ63268.1 cell surface protein [Secundilactobacillus paracollinoides]ANZ67546.1 cell surface protein [Secundilactobacillus paracollinoides]KRL79994.1 YbbR-like protein [Secundilactobacillus paracollinoides DSM 15502 = JCM 11969]
MKAFLNSRWLYRLISLFLAICLFLYVNSTKTTTSQSTDSSNDSTTLTTNEHKTISVQLRLNVNSDKYFVTGYPEKVKVHLSGPAALVTATSNTQNFRVMANLTKLSTGEHTVALQQEGLNRDLTYRIDPAKIKVNIQKRQTVTFPVTVNYDKTRIADNYEAGKATSDVTSVKATGAESEIDRINKVVAQVDLKQNAKSTVNSQAVIEALDKQGRTVNVILTPSTTQVNLPITSKQNSKKVPISFKVKNGSSDYTYSIKSSTSSVRVFGSKSKLADISSFEADIDVSDIKKSTTKTVSLDPDANGVTGVNPTSVKVSITTKQAD